MIEPLEAPLLQPEASTRAWPRLPLGAVGVTAAVLLAGWSAAIVGTSQLQAAVAALLAVAATAYSLRVHPSSSVIGFRRGDVPKWSAECALTARTPTPSATHARHGSPRGTERRVSGGSSRRRPLSVVAGVNCLSRVPNFRLGDI